jgi:hypothetical protein
MEAKFLTIILCLLVLEATGARLTNLTSIQHRTENASKAATVPTVDNTGTSTATNTGVSTATSTGGFVSPRSYSQQLYKLIEDHLPSDDDLGTQIAFIMIAQTPETRFVFPNQQVARALGGGRLPDLKTDQIFPRSARSNLVIAGVTYEDKPFDSSDLPFHSEQKLVPAMITMDDFNDHQQDRTLKNLVCPWLIVLGSTFDTCFDPNWRQSNAPQHNTI